MLQCFKAYRFHVAVQVALENCTIAAAEGMIRYGTYNGPDPWRNPFNHYVFGSEESQNIVIQQFYELKQVDEGSIDKFFIEAQCISEWCAKSRTENTFEKWPVVFIKRKILQKVATDQLLELRKLQTFDAIRNVVDIYRHEHRTRHGECFDECYVLRRMLTNKFDNTSQKPSSPLHHFRAFAAMQFRPRHPTRFVCSGQRWERQGWKRIRQTLGVWRVGGALVENANCFQTIGQSRWRSSIERKWEEQRQRKRQARQGQEWKLEWWKGLW